MKTDSNEIYKKFYIWEIRNIEKLVHFGDIRDITNERRIRNHAAKCLESLIRLIKVIEGSKKIEDLSKINKAFDSYNNTKNSQPKLLKPPVEKSTAKKSSNKRRINPDNHSISPIKPDSSNPLPLPSDPTTNPNPNPNPNPDSQQQTPLKKSKKPKSSSKSKSALQDESKENVNKSNKKDNQKKLLSFFSKRENSVTNEESESREECMGGTIEGNAWEAGDVKGMLTSLSKNYTLFQSQIQIRVRAARLSFVHISDSLNHTRVVPVGKGDTIPGRNPFYKNPLIDVNYELDSEDEYEEKCCGEDLGNSEDNQMDEEESEVFSEEDFIVPDGYLSDQERADSEKGENLHFSSFKTGNAPFFLLDLRNLESTSQDTSLEEFLSGFGMLNLLSPSQNSTIDIKPPKADPKANPLLTDDDLQRSLVRSIHGGFENKVDVINTFHIQYLHPSNNSDTKTRTSPRSQSNVV